MLNESLLQIGLNKIEVRIYLELLSIGPQPVSVLASRLKLNRTTLYAMLGNLEKKGIISFYKNGGSLKYFSANDPNCLVGYLDRKCRTYSYYKSQILSLIPKFRELCCDFDFRKPVVSYFEGIEGVKQLDYQILNAKKEYYCFFSMNKWLELGESDYIFDLEAALMKRKGLKSRILASDTKASRQFFADFYADDEMCKVLFLDPVAHCQLFENEVCIYDNKVVVLHLERGSEYGLLIESREFFLMQQSMFEILWQSLD